MDSQVAAKGVITNQKGEVLLLNHEGRWESPGGRLESGEMLRDGLKREIQEETGITEIEIGDVVHVDEWVRRDGKHVVAVYFRVTTTQADVTISHEHQDAAWVSLDKLKEYDVREECQLAHQKAFAK